MKNRINLSVLIPALLLLALTLAACEKDRPVPTPKSGSAQTGSSQALTATPAGVVTRVPAQSSTEAAPQTSPATPVPLESSGVTSPQPSGGATATGVSGTGQATTYRVQSGDTLGGIARKFGVTTDAIIRLNALTNPDVLTIGQELKIPAPGASAGQATSGQAGEQVYVVSRGDTLSSIAQRFGVSLAELSRLNNITNPDQIVVGQKLRIPASSATAPAAGQGRTYVVQQGDTLFKIAVRFGVTVAALQSANNIADPNKVYPGQVLKIP